MPQTVQSLANSRHLLSGEWCFTTSGLRPRALEAWSKIPAPLWRARAPRGAHTSALWAGQACRGGRRAPVGQHEQHRPSTLREPAALKSQPCTPLGAEPGHNFGGLSCGQARALRPQTSALWPARRAAGAGARRSVSMMRRSWPPVASVWPPQASAPTRPRCPPSSRASCFCARPAADGGRLERV